MNNELVMAVGAFTGRGWAGDGCGMTLMYVRTYETRRGGLERVYKY